MRKTIKRLGAVLLAMAMAVSVLCTGALAAETTYTLTINDTNKNHKYTAYQVFAGTVDESKKLSVTGWGDGVNLTSAPTEGTYSGKTLVQAIQAITVDSKTPFAGKTEPGDIAAVLGDTANNRKDSPVAAAFADVVANYLKGEGNPTGEWTDVSGNTPAHYSITGLTGGYYFVKSANTASTDVANTRYMLEVVGDATVAAKNGVPTVDKTVQNANNTNTDFADTTTAQVGQTVNFKLTGTLPSNYDYYKSYEYIFHDTLSKGLTLTDAQKAALFVKVYASQTEAEKDANGTDENTGVKLTAKSGDTGDYTVTVTPNGNTKTTSLKVAFNDLKTIQKDTNATITKDSVIVVYYSATINGSATAGGEGNKNSVKLEYSNDPNNTGTGTTKSDEVSVFTFKLDITKVKKSETTTKLSGAKFVLSKDKDLKIDVANKDTDLTDTDVTEKLIKVTGTTPNYVINDGTNTSATAQYIMETATGNNLGQLNITGLNKGVYYLYETKAPDGYNRITEPIKIEITEATTTEKDAAGKFSVKTLQYKINDGDEQNGTTTDGVIKADVENTSGSTLPSTGGMGTKLFYTIGGILMAGAAIVLVVRKRRSDAE